MLLRSPTAVGTGYMRLGHQENVVQHDNARATNAVFRSYMS